MNSLIFATGNKNKLAEAESILDIKIKGTSLEIPEVQSLDPVEVAIEKAKAYYEKIKKPLFVEDVSFVFNALNKLPGPYIDGFTKSLGNSGILELLKGKDRKAVAQTTIAYIKSKNKIYTFEGKMYGEISKSEKGENGFGWDPIFIPNGSIKTLAQMELEEKNKYSMRAKALKKFKNWFVNN